MESPNYESLLVQFSHRIAIVDITLINPIPQATNQELGNSLTSFPAYGSWLRYLLTTILLVLLVKKSYFLIYYILLRGNNVT